MSRGPSRIMRARNRLGYRGLLPCGRGLLVFLLISRQYRWTRRWWWRRRMFNMTCLACLVIARRLGPWLGVLTWPWRRRRGRFGP